MVNAADPARPIEGYALHSGIPRLQQLIGAILDPLRQVCISRASVGRVVLEAAILGWVMRRRDDDAICEVCRSLAVVNYNGPRDDRSRRHAVVSLDDRLDTVGRQDFQRRVFCRTRQGMSVLAQIKRPVDAPTGPVIANRLCDGEDVRLGERSAQRRATVTAGPENNPLSGVAHIGPPLALPSFEPRPLDQPLFRGRLTGERGDGHGPPFLLTWTAVSSLRGDMTQR